MARSSLTALRDAIDQLLDGERTGRWDWYTLRKTEKTHMGTIVEIRLHNEFDFDDGEAMDYRIAGIDVDCKFSQSVGGWELPPDRWVTFACRHRQRRRVLLARGLNPGSR